MGRMHRKSRDLVAWQPTEHDDEGYNDNLLENEESLDEDYDQFAANNIDAHFDETMYTSKLDKTSNEYQRNIKEAKEAEKNIMNQPTQSKHVSDDRAYYHKKNKKDRRNGMDEDEEDAYSRVIHEDNRHTTNNKKNSYVAPHLRNSTNSQNAKNNQSNKRKNNNRHNNNNQNNNNQNNAKSQDQRNQPNHQQFGNPNMNHINS